MTATVDVLRVLRILKKNNFNGVIIPDHAPQMSCAAPWHAGHGLRAGLFESGVENSRSRKLAVKKMLTGSPADPRHKILKVESGFIPYSIRGYGKN